MLHNKFWQAFFALAPFLIFFCLFIGYGIFLIAAISEGSHVPGDPDHLSGSLIFGSLGTFLLLLFLAVFLSLASLVFFIVHAVQNPNLKGNNLLIVWILLFVFVGGISQLLYWIIEIVNKRNGSV